MNQFGIKLLKALFTIIVMCSSFLYITVTPSSEEASSVLNLAHNYNSVPYREGAELAFQDDAVLTSRSGDIAIETFVGTVTAYGPDCVGCSGVTASGYRVASNVDGITNVHTITYNDKEYGDVRVFAAAPSKFPYGTILRISGERIEEPITGIVLDTGGAMRNAWGRGEILLDLLFNSEKDRDVYDFGRQKNVKIEVLRYAY